MRIRNPPECIMSISIIMSLIMTLLVFQCNELAAPAEGPRLQKCRLGQPICRGDAAPSRLLAHGKQPTRRSLDPRAPRSLLVRLFFFVVVVVVVVFVFFSLLLRRSRRLLSLVFFVFFLSPRSGDCAFALPPWNRRRKKWVSAR